MGKTTYSRNPNTAKGIHRLRLSRQDIRQGPPSSL